jgi:hypothetical protein
MQKDTVENSKQEKFPSPQKPPFGLNAPCVTDHSSDTGRGKSEIRATSIDKPNDVPSKNPSPSRFKNSETGLLNVSQSVNIFPRKDTGTGKPICITVFRKLRQTQTRKQNGEYYKS